jgi:hypothetical protein
MGKRQVEPEKNDGRDAVSMCQAQIVSQCRVDHQVKSARNPSEGCHPDHSQISLNR